ncbi:DUF6766 family protein [Micromonospora sp. NPDC050187]|uniref:DUF6766 family protein n=1 Tax=Micromonospora sp. NPDC050187 TaxID=3364277 RepID=UPI0037930A90
MGESTVPTTGRSAPPVRTGGSRRDGPPFRKPRWPRAYAFALVTGALFVFSWIGQFLFQMTVAGNEARQHGESFAWGDFLPQFLASTFENWQSEFLQLIWQAAGLALFYYWGSSQSRESDERIEAKLDALLRERGLDPDRP